MNGACLSVRAVSERTTCTYDKPIDNEIAIDSAEEQNAAMVLVSQRLCLSERTAVLICLSLVNSNCSLRWVLPFGESGRTEKFVFFLNEAVFCL